jgi:hypothetical protein
MGYLGAACRERLSELTDYRENSRHCNVPKLKGKRPVASGLKAKAEQLSKLHRVGKMTAYDASSRIQALKTFWVWSEL